MNDDKFLSAQELSARWGGAVKVGTLSNWRGKKKGPPFVKLGANVRYRLVDVVEWEAKNLIANDNDEPAQGAA